MTDNQQTEPSDHKEENWLTRLRDQTKRKLKGDVVIGDVGAGSRGIAIGKNIVQIGTLVIPMFPVMLVILLLASASILFLIQPRPQQKMAGEFNIAIASFQTDGQPSNDTFDVAQVFYGRLKSEIENLGTRVNIIFEIRDPASTGLIVGRTKEERAASAEELAQKITADLVVYGAVATDGASKNITPEFFVNIRSFSEAEEIIGQYRLGGTIKLDGLLDSPLQKQRLNQELSARTSALSLLTLGLSYYVRDDYKNALYYFDRAKEIKEWGEGREVVLVLSGYSALKQGLTKQAFDDCTEALRLNGEYSRAYICLGDVQYKEAVGEKGSDSYDQINLQMLDQAISTFSRARGAKDQPAGANIPDKVHLALGQCYLLKAAATQGDLSQAAIELRALVDDYERSSVHDERLRELASSAYAHLGLVYRLSNNPQEATSMYERAVELTRNVEQKALYSAQLAETYVAIGNSAKAIEWYSKAIAFSSEGSDSRRKYEQRLNALRPIAIVTPDSR